MPAKAAALKPSSLLPYALITAATAAAAFFTSTVFAAETYTLDPNHTNIIWNVSHFGFSSPSGRFGIKEGSVTLDEKTPSASKVKVTIDVAALETGIPAFNEHLESKDFLDATTYPTATFTSTGVETTGASSAKVTGNLTLHGVTKPVTLDVKLNKIGIMSRTNEKTAGFSATGSFKRSDFGISAGIPDVADEVRLTIESEANIKAAK